jgi:hypothetical protein
LYSALLCRGHVAARRKSGSAAVANSRRAQTRLGTQLPGTSLRMSLSPCAGRLLHRNPQRRFDRMPDPSEYTTSPCAPTRPQKAVTEFSWVFVSAARTGVAVPVLVYHGSIQRPSRGGREEEGVDACGRLHSASMATSVSAVDRLHFSPSMGGRTARETDRQAEAHAVQARRPTGAALGARLPPYSYDGKSLDTSLGVLSTCILRSASSLSNAGPNLVCTAGSGKRCKRWISKLSCATLWSGLAATATACLTSLFLPRSAPPSASQENQRKFANSSFVKVSCLARVRMYVPDTLGGDSPPCLHGQACRHRAAV